MSAEPQDTHPAAHTEPLVEFVEWLLSAAEDPAQRRELTLNDIEREAVNALRRHEDAKEAESRV